VFYPNSAKAQTLPDNQPVYSDAMALFNTNNNLAELPYNLSSTSTPYEADSLTFKIKSVDGGTYYVGVIASSTGGDVQCYEVSGTSPFTYTFPIESGSNPFIRIVFYAYSSDSDCVSFSNKLTTRSVDLLGSSSNPLPNYTYSASYLSDDSNFDPYLDWNSSIVSNLTINYPPNNSFLGGNLATFQGQCPTGGHESLSITV